MSGIGIGDMIMMQFHYEGAITAETWYITDMTDKYVILEDWIFEKETGRCVNDNNTFGAKRTINPIR